MNFKRHSFFRILERSSLRLYDIDIILKNKCYVKIGMDTKKKDVCHYLFYSVVDQAHYVLVIDEKKEEVITMLPPNSSVWHISAESFQSTEVLATLNFKINNIIKQDDKFIAHFLSVRQNKKNEIIEKFYNEKIPFIMNLLPFKNLIELSEESIFCKIIFHFLKHDFIFNKPITQSSNNELFIFNVVFFNSQGNITFRHYFDFNQKTFDYSIISENLQKINLNLSIDNVLYIFIQDKNNKNIAVLIPNGSSFDCFQENSKIDKLNCINLLNTNKYQVSFKKFKYLNESHITQYFLNNLFLKYINYNFLLKDFSQLEFYFTFGQKRKKYSIVNKIYY